MVNIISKKIRGFRDILPDESEKFSFIEKQINNICPLFNTNQVRIPTLESINLFKRSIGETSDIVTKEMYSFSDKNNDIVCMIPEGTASCMRLAFENNLIYDRGIKKNRLYYYSSMFRHERPQKGRYRQFTQFGVEFFGDKSVTDDIDLILMSDMFFRKININDLKLNINSLGSSDDRNKYSNHLREYFNKYLDSLSDQQRQTLNKNPLRLLDSKDKKLLDIIDSAPTITQYINKDSIENFDRIMSSLSDLKINFNVDTKLVRGLDYYNDLVFEWKTDKLGTQDALCAGGRYDNLSLTVANQHVPAVGFAMGIDRIVNLLNFNTNKFTVGLSVITSNYNNLAQISSAIRDIDHNFRLIQMDTEKSLSKQIKMAVKYDCDILIIVGNDEMSNNTLTIKHLKKTKEDESISFNDLSNIIREN
tara:strand:+ start:179 stop:1438 length:1260 start_codon:yes stop_codon:yes gene_type:complete